MIVILKSSITYGKLRVHVLSDEKSGLVDGVVERVRTDRIIVSVSNIDTRYSSNVDKRCVVTAWTQDRYSM